jgi:diketogulonate reductase-like aldo/keto reductase
VEEGRLRVNETLTQIAARYKITPYQVALAWLVQQANVIAIPMSMNPAHQKENFDAAALELDEDALALLDARG